MGKITNIVLNSGSKTSGTVTNNLTYYIDWSAILKRNKKYKLKFNYMGGYNHINSYRFPYITSNIPINSYAPGTNTSYNLGNLYFFISQQSLNIGNLMAHENHNSTLYLQTMPLNNNLNIQILDNISNTPFFDEFFSVAGAGTATSSGNVLTIVSSTTGVIQLGTVITIGANSRTIISFLTGTGGTGTYQIDSSLTVGTATAYTYPANQTGNAPAPYILNLSFEEIDDE